MPFKIDLKHPLYFLLLMLPPPWNYQPPTRGRYQKKEPSVTFKFSNLILFLSVKNFSYKKIFAHGIQKIDIIYECKVDTTRCNVDHATSYLGTIHFDKDWVDTLDNFNKLRYKIINVLVKDAKSVLLIINLIHATSEQSILVKTVKRRT